MMQAQGWSQFCSQFICVYLFVQMSSVQIHTQQRRTLYFLAASVEKDSQLHTSVVICVKHLDPSVTLECSAGVSGSIANTPQRRSNTAQVLAEDLMVFRSSIKQWRQKYS